ncbi:MAG: methionine adenosyltransferase [bacterium]|jgi:S-adenosylmethionine synthetase
MKKQRHLFTSESVTEGHPDKVADQISDSILDEIMAQDPNGRVACETLVTTGLAFIAGEISTKCYVEIPRIARNLIKDIGYTNADYGFDYETCAVLTSIDEQSPDIAMGVDREGAGDQGMMFGYAARETPEFMPLPITLAHKIVRGLDTARRNGVLPYLRPDGKSQVTVEYVDGRPVGVRTVVVAAQHHPDITEKQLRDDVIDKVISQVIPGEMLKGQDTRFYVNETGRFVVGGPQGDCGLTGRKIIVDTYGGVGSHGGGCFSGKDPTKVDRSGSYMARYVAKNIVAAGLADRCELQIAYAIGIAEPVSVMVDTFDTGQLPDEDIAEMVTRSFDLRPRAIIETLKLRRPVYRRTAAYGHFGREEEGFTWEIADRVEDLKKAA